jgi:transmembrane sensor
MAHYTEPRFFSVTPIWGLPVLICRIGKCQPEAMPESPSKQLLFDFFAGKSTALQKQWIADWLKETENRRLYYQYLNEWESQHPQYRPDVQPALDRFRAAVQQIETASEPSPFVAVSKGGFWSSQSVWFWAASVLLALTIGSYLSRNSIRYETYSTAYGETRSFQLADGTTVALNANSTLRVPRWGFGQQEREVKLDGEAEFNVSHLANHQRFVVRTSTDFAVEVLGTEFVVFARDQRRKVILSRGKVKVMYQAGKQLVMRPGDWVSLGESGQLQRKITAQPAKFSSWKQHRFTFDQTSLAEICQLIYENFGLTVRVTDSTLAQRRISGVFKAEKPDELVDDLVDLLQVRSVKSNGSIDIQPIAN